MGSYVEIRANRTSKGVSEGVDVMFLRHAIEGKLSQFTVQENSNGSHILKLIVGVSS